MISNPIVDDQQAQGLEKASRVWLSRFLQGD